MTQRWEDVSFLHWDVDPSTVQGVLPPPLEVHRFEGRAWIGLVPFQMRNIAPAGLSPIPYLGTFPETNVRTYVIGPDGEPGVWFSSLESSRLLPVAIARAGYALPYFYGAMGIRRSKRTIQYNTLRRWPGPRGVGGQIDIHYGERILRPDTLERFLTSRWRLFTVRNGNVYSAEIRHHPWPLHRASATALDTSLVTAAGYPQPSRAPHVLYSPGVDVEAWAPRRVKAKS